MTDCKAFEHSTLIVPYEFLNKSFRNAQKNIDKDVSQTNASNEKLRKLSSKNSTTVGDAAKELDNMLVKLKSMKRKANESINEEQKRLVTCQSRLKFIKEEGSVKKPLIMKYNKSERLLIDYFLRSGFYETAMKMIGNSQVKECIDLDLFMIARDIENSLKNHQLHQCLDWCHNNKTKLKKIQSTLELNLRMQEFVELIKSGQRKEAIFYARKYFSSQVLDSETAPEVEKNVMVLLAFNKSTQIKKYQEFFSNDRWLRLVEQFRREIFMLYQLKSQSMLEVILQCGLAAMKTPHCYHEEERNQDCPICSSFFNKLAKPLPFAHSSQSQLLCSLSGEKMNDGNPPLMLPNGNVYSELALKDMASSVDAIVCPRTNEQYDMNDVKKIFIM